MREVWFYGRSEVDSESRNGELKKSIRRFNRVVVETKKRILQISVVLGDK